MLPLGTVLNVDERLIFVCSTYKPLVRSDGRTFASCIFVILNIYSISSLGNPEAHSIWKRSRYSFVLCSAISIGFLVSFIPVNFVLHNIHWHSIWPNMCGGDERGGIQRLLYEVDKTVYRSLNKYGSNSNKKQQRGKKSIVWKYFDVIWDCCLMTEMVGRNLRHVREDERRKLWRGRTQEYNISTTDQPQQQQQHQHMKGHIIQLYRVACTLICRFLPIVRVHVQDYSILACCLWLLTSTSWHRIYRTGRNGGLIRGFLL